MNVAKVWEAGFTGTGLTLSVLDDGVADGIEEIKQNFVSSTLCLNMIVNDLLTLLIGPSAVHI